LTISGISSKALSFGTPQNRYKFNDGNELQSNEFTDGSGLETYDAHHRMYDPQIGRFFQIDELAESNWEWTP
jgi:RHS repeat-associated protein